MRYLHAEIAFVGVDSKSTEAFVKLKFTSHVNFQKCCNSLEQFVYVVCVKTNNSIQMLVLMSGREKCGVLIGIL